MFERLGRFIYRRRKLTFALFSIIIVTAGAIGSTAIAKLSNGGYSVDKSDSKRAADYLINTFHTKDPAAAIVIRSNAGANAPATAADVKSLEQELAKVSGVASTTSYWDTGASALLSRDGKAGYLFVYAINSDPTTATELGNALETKYLHTYKSLTLFDGGFAPFNYSISEKISKDLALAEGISIPLTFLLLIFVFGGLVASAMPLVVGVGAILGGLFIIWLITLITPVSIFALNLLTGMGLGLGIDYSLLIVNRFREELHQGKSVEEATIKTVATAGRTVFFSGITVIITLASLLFFPLMFLKSFGYAGVTVVAMAIIGAIIPLPAILAMLGAKVDKYTVRKSAITPKADGGWAKTARFVMKRPISVVLAALAILVIIASPIRNIVFAQVDTRVMPASSPISIASNEMAADFPGQQGNPIDFIIPNGATQSDLITYQQAVSKVSGILTVTPASAAGKAIHFTAIESMAPRTPQAQRMIQNIRAISFPGKVFVGGVAADYTDSQLGISHTLPWALGWIALGVLILLFMFTGSLILPVKAVLLNALSLAAMMGAITWVFIEGHLMWLVGKFQITGSIDTSMVILVSVVTFGLSMDYEVFLLSRIREEHEAGHNSIESVAIGLQRSARIITAAALLLAIVFAAFITSGVTSIKTLGLGVAVAILLDATLIRALLVPALMRLFGELNWWAPAPLKRFTIKH